MANDLLNELNRNLANAEEVGNEEWATALKVRIAELGKAAKAPAPAASKAEPVTKAAAPKKAAKKAKK